MKILLINASARENGATFAALTECENEAKRLLSDTELISLGGEARHACIGCGHCKSGGGCVFPDIQTIYNSANSSDAFIIGSPSHYFGATGTLISVLSRLFYSGTDAFLHKPVAVIGVGRRGGIYESISDIERFFRFSSSPIVTATYPPILYASDSKSAEYDAEGLQNMREITKNLVWLTKCISLAREQGITPYPSEKKIKTDIASLGKIQE